MTESAPGPVTELDPRFSAEGVPAVPWARASEQLLKAGVYWVSTVRPGGQPHVTTIAGIWMDDAFYFATGPDERKTRNLAANPQCAITTGRPEFREGLDIVLEGSAVPVTDETVLRRLAQHFAEKYNDFFGFTVRDGSFRNEAGGEVLIFQVAPRRAYGFGKGEFSQTRWQFSTD